MFSWPETSSLVLRILLYLFIVSNDRLITIFGIVVIVDNKPSLAIAFKLLPLLMNLDEKNVPN